MAFDFKATNDEKKLVNLFENRKQYRDGALFSDGVYEAGLEDFYIDKRLSYYGRIDDNDNFVIPYRKTMSFFDSNMSPGTPTGRPMALNFVVDAYKGFIGEFERLLRRGTCGVTAEDIGLSVIQAWVPLRPRVDQHYAAVSKAFLNNALRANDKDGSVYKRINALRTFEQFARKMLQFYEKAGRHAPVTMTGILSSKHCFLNHTGLCITLTELKKSDDTEKSVFLNKRIFSFYIQAAQSHGFMINRNAPWQIIANLDSLEMQQYMENRFTSPEQVWTTHYRRTHFIEIEDFKKRLINSWNVFVSAYPDIVDKEVACHGRPAVTKISKRQLYSDSDMRSKYNNHFWIEVLCGLKNSETNEPLTVTQLSGIIKNAIKIENNLDMTAALDYINDQYKSHPLNNRMEPIKFHPKQEVPSLGQVSEYQSNVIVESATYYDEMVDSSATEDEPDSMY